LLYNFFIGLPQEKVLTIGFKNSKSKLYNVNMNYWAKINSKLMKEKQLKKVVANALQQLNISKQGNIKMFKDKNVKKAVWIEKENQINSNTTIIAENIKNKVTKNYESYLIINKDLGNNIDKVSNTKSKMIRIYNNYNSKPITNICVTGYYNGKLNFKNINLICDRMLKNMQAKKIDQVRIGDTFSLTAYSPMMNLKMNSAGEKINLNLACNYNNYEDRTYVNIASPTILKEY
jgi:hypothetical protein